jgi:E3 ubiquitin-protein ligase TRIP12
MSTLDGSKIEAQTPDGTRVATPNASSREGLLAMARNSLSSRGSYAAALKAKPTDWHLEFSMDDHILPLDLTIYGAIHQHEMRKKSGATPLHMIWQGVYTVKFKKVPGPAPSPESMLSTLLQVFIYLIYDSTYRYNGLDKQEQIVHTNSVLFAR